MDNFKYDFYNIQRFYIYKNMYKSVISPPKILNLNSIKTKKAKQQFKSQFQNNSQKTNIYGNFHYGRISW